MFSGIGGFEYGIEKAYAENKSKDCSNGKKSAPQYDRCPLCIGFSEIDKYAIQIYKRHFPNHKNWGNCRDIIPEQLPDFDLLVGGFPCQSFSIAGKRGGFEDTRGTLFFEIARIVKVKRPKLLLLENVKGLLSHDNGRTFGTILATLSDLGYVCEWQILNSKNFGVPQNRERVFIVGHLGGISGRAVFPIREDSEADIVLPTLHARYEGGQANGSYLREKSQQGIKQLNNPKHSNDRVYGDKGLSPALNTMQGGNRQPKVQRTPLKFLDRNQKNIDGDYSFTIDSLNTGGVSIGSRIRRLTPTECERLQGFPDGWTAGVSDSQRYKCLGNAVTTNVIDAVVSELLKIGE